MAKTALFVLAAGVEELEAVAPIDILRRAGITVTLAGLVGTAPVVGRNQIALGVDVDFAEVHAKLFDAFILPGGAAVGALRADARVAAAAVRHHEAGKLVAAICAAPTLLGQAGLLRGRRYTAYPSVADELPEILSNERLVEDGLIITSRGAGTSIDFGLAIARRLTSAAQADEVRTSICA